MLLNRFLEIFKVAFADGFEAHLLQRSPYCLSVFHVFFEVLMFSYVKRESRNQKATTAQRAVQVS